jgi:iron complex transport system substrate-binding protein
MHARSTRRTFLLSTAGAAAAFGLAACGSDDEAAGGGASTGTNASGAAAAYPIAVEHEHGKTTIEKAPERIVSYGYTDADPMLAMGVVPVGLLQWIPQWKRGVGAWAVPQLGSSRPDIYSGNTIQYEKVAASRPDLILAVTYALKKDEYDKLSQIAPTVTTVAGFPDWGTPWQSATEQVGRALGRTEKAKQLVAQAEARFEQAKADHPSFAGKQVLLVAPGNNGKLNVFAPTDTRGRFVTSLGFTQPDAIKQATGGQFYAEISEERYDLVDVDALIVMAEDPAIRAALVKQPAYKNLKVVREGRAIMSDDLEVNMALSASTVTSIPYALDRIVPELDRALSKV